jgi:DNA adenine methylase
MPSIIRYPGSKAKLVKHIRQSFPEWMVGRLWDTPDNAGYIEPFFGSGAVGLEVLEHVNRSIKVWLNDADYGMYALWHAVLSDTERLVKYVEDFEPSTDSFYKLKAEDGQSTGCIALDGFRKIALHRQSVSGFGRMSGGPLGGRDQGSQYTVGCRWTPSSVVQAIYNAKETLRKFAYVKITNLHFRDVLAEARANCFIYLDPPYYVKGGQLYAHNMSHDEHVELASALHSTQADWRLSYDDCEEIRALYPSSEFSELEVRYTNATSDNKRRKNKELLISPALTTA